MFLRARSFSIRFVAYAIALAMSVTASNAQAIAAEPQWESLLSKADVEKSAVAGQWRKSGDTLTVQAAQGARLSLPAAPSGDYDLRATFTRRTGQHSVGLIVTHAGQQVVFEVDAWGKNLAGFQNVGGKSIQENRSRHENVRLENNKKYTLTVEVRQNHLRGLLDGKEIATLETDGSDLSIPDVWSMPDRSQLGLVAWECDTTFHSIEIRSLSAETAVTASTLPPAKSAAQKSTARSAEKMAPKTAPKSPASASKSAVAAAKKADVPTTKSTTGKRVLIVIANHHFFYREYGDPRQELERAGIQVTVAAGRKAPCRPHESSGQGPDGGVVQPDLALSEVDVNNFDAVLFSGGWGASMYQFAFPGRYNDASYNGDRETKAEANRIINEFLAQDKYTCALCNAVSVLAWARVDGKSPLAGKRVCAPPRQAPPGIYNGRPGQPSCRWHPESNGARLSPAGAVGQPGSAADDVLVDGKIITGEDDISAREMGRRIVEVLTK